MIGRRPDPWVLSGTGTMFRASVPPKVACGYGRAGEALSGGEGSF